MPTPRPHYKERIAHAEGYEIEFLDGCGVWVLDSNPDWYVDWQYRVKPEPKPDVVRVVNIIRSDSSGLLLVEGSSNSNLRLTFDGETGKLKSAEVI